MSVRERDEFGGKEAGVHWEDSDGFWIVHCCSAFAW